MKLYKRQGEVNMKKTELKAESFKISTSLNLLGQLFYTPNILHKCGCRKVKGEGVKAKE